MDLPWQTTRPAAWLPFKVDEACEVGLAALRIASEVQSIRTVAYLVDLVQRLAPFRAEPAVRMLDEQIGLLVQ